MLDNDPKLLGVSISPFRFSVSRTVKSHYLKTFLKKRLNKPSELCCPACPTVYNQYNFLSIAPAVTLNSFSIHHHEELLTKGFRLLFFFCCLIFKRCEKQENKKSFCQTRCKSFNQREYLRNYPKQEGSLILFFQASILSHKTAFKPRT